MSIKSQLSLNNLKTKFLIGIVTILILLFSSNSTVFASIGGLNSVNSQAIINNDGTVKIIQTWNYDDRFSSAGTEHFINMNIAYESQNYSGKEEFMSNYKVFLNNQPLEYVDNWDVNDSFSQKAGKYGIIHKQNSIELCFGITEYSKNEFRVEYLVHNVIKETIDGAKYLHWTFTPTDLDPQPTSLSATIETLGGVTIDKVYGFNYQGEVRFDNMSKKDKVIAVMENGSYTYDTALNIFVSLEDNKNILVNSTPVNMSLKDKIEEIFEGSDYDINVFYEETQESLGSSKNSSDSSNGFAIDSTLSMIGFVLMSIIVFILSSMIPIIMLVVIFLAIRNFSSEFSIFKDIDKRELKAIMEDKDTYRRDEPDETIDFYPILKRTMGITTGNQNVLMYFISKWTSEGVFEYIDKTEREVGLIFKKVKEIVTFRLNEYNLNREITPLERELFDSFSKLTRNNILTTDDLSKLEIREIEKTFSRHMKVYKENLTEYGYISGQGKEARLNEEGLEVIRQHAGLRNYLKDFTLINEREISEVELWDYYFHMAALYGIADTFKKQLDLLPNLNQDDTYNKYYGNSSRALLNKNISEKMSRNYSAYRNRNSGGGGSSSRGGGGGSSGGGSGGGTR